MIANDSQEQAALTFARTLLNKTPADAIGQLVLVFDMDVVSAKALIWIIHLETR